MMTLLLPPLCTAAALPQPALPALQLRLKLPHTANALPQLPPTLLRLRLRLSLPPTPLHHDCAAAVTAAATANAVVLSLPALRLQLRLQMPPRCQSRH